MFEWNHFPLGSFRDMPSSYEGKWGRITYSLRAQLTQSIWLVHKTKTEFPFWTKSEFPFASKSEMIIIGLQVKDKKKTKLFSFWTELNFSSPKCVMTYFIAFFIIIIILGATTRN